MDLDRAALIVAAEEARTRIEAIPTPYHTGKLYKEAWEHLDRVEILLEGDGSWPTARYWLEHVNYYLDRLDQARGIVRE